MNHRIILTILLLIKMACYSQVEKLIHNLNGKGIEFKNKYETVVADYETDTTTFVTKSNQTVDLAA